MLTDLTSPSPIVVQTMIRRVFDELVHVDTLLSRKEPDLAELRAKMSDVMIVAGATLDLVDPVGRDVQHRQTPHA